MTQRFAVRTIDLSWRQVDDEIVVLDLATSKYLSLNGTGALLWPTLVDGASAADLSAQLVREFDIPVEQADADVDAFLQHCLRVGVVV